MPLLPVELRRWMAERGWEGLRELQERAFGPVLRRRDVLIAGPTASGKTKAALLPALTGLLERPGWPGVGVLYVCPTRALINDLHRRASELCGRVGIAVHAWHGERSAKEKARVRENPHGVLVITSEALEGVLAREGHDVARILEGLRHVVVDEFHACMGTERGAQVRAQLARIEDALGRSVPRIGLSATVFRPRVAAEWLRPGGGDRVAVVAAPETRIPMMGLRCQVAEGGRHGAVEPAAPDVVAELAGKTSVVFVNSRAGVERHTRALHAAEEAAGTDLEVAAHHSSVSRSRHAAEALLREGAPVAVVATSTLELGIDIGSMELVVQLGPPPSPSALAQRLARSGRRGGRPRLLLVVSEPVAGPEAALVDRLHPPLVQTIATVQLVLEGTVEAPNLVPRHLSTRGCPDRR